MLQIVNVTKQVPGVRALHDVSFDVTAGEVHAVIGENGAGKSTLMKILSGVYAGYEGQIRFQGRPLALTDVVAAACAQEVPVIVLDRKVNGDQFTMWIGADNVEFGRRAGERAAAYCEEQGHDPCNVIEIRGLEGSTPAQERDDGFREGNAANPAV